MSEPGLFREFAVRGAHPTRPRAWLQLSLPDEIEPCIRMASVPLMSSIGLSPSEARELAGELVALAEASECREEAERRRA